MNIFENAGNIFCRTCLHSEVNLRSIESIYRNSTKTLRNILTSMGFIKQSLSCVASEYICSNCIEQLGSAFQFKLLCEKSDATLQEYHNGKCTPLQRNEFLKNDLQIIENVTETPRFNSVLNNYTRKTGNSDDEKQKLSDIENTTKPTIIVNKTFICDHCSWSASNLSNLKCHMKKVHEKPKQRYICNVCGNSLTSRNGYYVHMKIHEGKKNHICTKCGAKFVTSTSLTVHMRVHDEKKPFPCTYINCERTFQTKAAMNTHMRCTHTKERPFKCDICLKTFSIRSNFIIHCRTHLHIKSVNCNICSIPLSNRQSLKKHMRIHTGERPYMCHECGDQLISSSSLSVHRKIKHSNIQHECHTCHKRFHLLPVLRKHLKIHSR